MPGNLDLFNDVSITHDDINLWLDCNNPHLSNTRKDYYVKTYDVATKIKLSIINDSFKKLIKQDDAPPETYSAFQTKYKCDTPEPPPPCNKMKCYCELKSCKFRKLILRRARNRRYYVKTQKTQSNQKQKG